MSRETMTIPKTEEIVTWRNLKKFPAVYTKGSAARPRN